MSAKKNNKNNIFIGTIDLNKTMNDIEGEIERHIRKNEQQYMRILYRVTPQYKGKNQIPMGVLIEAKGLDTEYYNLCVFCYNVEDKVKFNYTDGTIIEDKRIIAKNKLFQNIKKSYVNNMQKKNENSNINLVIDDKSKIYHTEDCILPNNIDPKYIKEITTKEQIIKNKGYTKCKECFK